MQFICSCDYLPLCCFVILQPLAADQEIMKSQTHCASQWMRADYSTCPDRMLTREDVVIHSNYADTKITTLKSLTLLTNFLHEMPDQVATSEPYFCRSLHIQPGLVHELITLATQQCKTSFDSQTSIQTVRSVALCAHWPLITALIVITELSDVQVQMLPAEMLQCWGGLLLCSWELCHLDVL